MDAVAYIDPAVITFINETFVPLRLPAADKELGTRYKVKWTPALLILDGEGGEQYRTLGFYPPQQLIPSLLLGLGKAKFNLPDRLAACEAFTRVFTEYPHDSLAPEAVYLYGVTRYIETRDAANLTALYDRLTAEYPQSPWATRADPYRLLKK